MQELFVPLGTACNDDCCWLAWVTTTTTICSFVEARNVSEKLISRRQITQLHNAHREVLLCKGMNNRLPNVEISRLRGKSFKNIMEMS